MCNKLVKFNLKQTCVGHRLTGSVRRLKISDKKIEFLQNNHHSLPNHKHSNYNLPCPKFAVLTLKHKNTTEIKKNMFTNKPSKIKLYILAETNQLSKMNHKCEGLCVMSQIPLNY